MLQNMYLKCNSNKFIENYVKSKNNVETLKYAKYVKHN